MSSTPIVWDNIFIFYFFKSSAKLALLKHKYPQMIAAPSNLAWQFVFVYSISAKADIGCQVLLLHMTIIITI